MVAILPTHKDTMFNDCSGIPTSIAAPTPTCPNGYQCVVTNPYSETCSKKRYIFSPSFIKNGYILKGASGAYVPAVTVCKQNLMPIKVSEVAKKPSVKLVALPESQIVTVN